MLGTCSSAPARSPADSLLDEAKTFRFLGFPSGENNFIALPINAAASSVVDMGKVTIDGADDAKSEHALSSDQFNFDQALLDQLAGTNRALKRVINAFVNVNRETGRSVNAGTSFNWKAPLSALQAVEGSELADLVYKAYQLSFETESDPTGLTIAKLCGAANRGKLKLHPPVSRATDDPGTHTYNFVEFYKSPDWDAGTQGDKYCPMLATDGGREERFFCDERPLTNDDVGDSDPMASNRCSTPNGSIMAFSADEELRGEGEGQQQLVRWSWGGGDGFTGPVPEGFWRVTYDNAPVAFFDFNKGYPFRAGDGKPTTFLPKVKVTRDGNQLVTGVRVAFLIWSDAADDYVTASKEVYLRTTASTSIGLQPVGSNNGDYVSQKEPTDPTWPSSTST